jgi:hypothetical protein
MILQALFSFEHYLVGGTACLFQANILLEHLDDFQVQQMVVAADVWHTKHLCNLSVGRGIVSKKQYT